MKSKCVSCCCMGVGYLSLTLHLARAPLLYSISDMVQLSHHSDDRFRVTYQHIASMRCRRRTYLVGNVSSERERRSSRFEDNHLVKFALVCNLYKVTKEVNTFQRKNRSLLCHIHMASSIFHVLLSRIFLVDMNSGVLNPLKQSRSCCPTFSLAIVSPTSYQVLVLGSYQNCEACIYQHRANLLVLRILPLH